MGRIRGQVIIQDIINLMPVNPRVSLGTRTPYIGPSYCSLDMMPIRVDAAIEAKQIFLSIRKLAIFYN
jgi:hypothetical protein